MIPKLSYWFDSDDCKFLMERMKSKGFTLQSLSSIIGCTRQYLWQVFNGKCGISSHRLDVIKNLLGLGSVRNGYENNYFFVIKERS